MAKVTPEERLLNLIIALMHAGVRMTKDDIRARVAGYEAEDSAWDDETAKRRKATFERMFERDKDALRKLGVPVVTVRSHAHGDDIGYRIDPDQATLPPIDFTPAESAVIALAADYWRGAALGVDASQAWVKAASHVPHGEVAELPFATLSTHLTDATATLVEAVQQRQVVSFEYASASSGDRRRRVEPWRIQIRGGVDYLVGFDQDRQAKRTFRLSRVLGNVKLEGDPEAYTIPESGETERDSAQDEPKIATLVVKPEAAHELRRRAVASTPTAGGDLIEVSYFHREDVRERVLALGGAVTVVTPEDLAAEVVEYAQAALTIGSSAEEADGGR
ncbi:YafY family protein [Demequina sp. B12]|uniref:helix-turn-helix transcriptional regulator n=1 Tax=Demequina sp. B12 TaxID=2992757 RepID=UPI00237C03CD|nr:WYL domain-containing protein [Demequina sp. B12]